MQIWHGALVVCACCAAGAAAQQKAAQPPPSEMDRAVEEFRIQTRSLETLAHGTAVGVRTAASHQEWHGRLYEYFRNDFLDAVPHEVAQRGGTKSVLRRNQFGFSISGPVLIPKLLPNGSGTFFTLTYYYCVISAGRHKKGSGRAA